MATNQRRAGVASMMIDGVAEDVVGELAYDTSTVKREGLVGQSGPQGFSEMPKYGSISAKLRTSNGRTTAEYNSVTNATIVCELANGLTVTGSQMFQAGEDLKVNTQEGSVDVTFYGTVEES